MESLARILNIDLEKIGFAGLSELLNDGDGSENSENSEKPEFPELPELVVPAEAPEQLRRRLIASGFPPIYLDRPPSEYLVDDDNREAIATAREFVSSSEGKKGLYICGGFGTGKTWLAVLIGRKMAERGEYVCFGTFSELTDKLRRALQREGEYGLLWERLTKNARLLIIDDIGKEKPTEWKLQTLFDIIDTRERNGLLTVFTSNYSLAELCERITPASGKPGFPCDDVTAGAVRSRLAGSRSQARYVPITLLGADRR